MAIKKINLKLFIINEKQGGIRWKVANNGKISSESNHLIRRENWGSQKLRGMSKFTQLTNMGLGLELASPGISIGFNTSKVYVFKFFMNIHSFHSYVFSTFYVLGIIFSPKDTGCTNIIQTIVFALMKLYIYSLWGNPTLNHLFTKWITTIKRTAEKWRVTQKRWKYQLSV